MQELLLFQNQEKTGLRNKTRCQHQRTPDIPQQVFEKPSGGPIPTLLRVTGRQKPLSCLIPYTSTSNKSIQTFSCISFTETVYHGGRKAFIASWWFPAAGLQDRSKLNLSGVGWNECGSLETGLRLSLKKQSKHVDSRQDAFKTPAPVEPFVVKHQLGQMRSTL